MSSCLVKYQLFNCSKLSWELLNFFTEKCIFQVPDKHYPLLIGDVLLGFYWVTQDKVKWPPEADFMLFERFPVRDENAAVKGMNNLYRKRYLFFEWFFVCCEYLLTARRHFSLTSLWNLNIFWKSPQNIYIFIL